MPRFSAKSLSRLDTCVPYLQEIVKEAIEVVDFSVICGHRLKNQQDNLFVEGFSKAKWPLSKHNNWPSRAVDLAPWPINWDDRERFFFLAGVILTIAKRNPVKDMPLRWGGAWDGSFNVKGQFDDLAHFELLH